MTIDDVIGFAQRLLTDGLVLVVGSGLSAAEGMPGMPGIAGHLKATAGHLAGPDAILWGKISADLDAGQGLEAALLKNEPSESLQAWIVTQICELLLPCEKKIVTEVVQGKRILRLTHFLSRVLKPPVGIPIITPNYDRLIEVACEMSGLHVDTTAMGDYAAVFDHTRSCMRSCRGIVNRGRTTTLDHQPRAIVLKPHGSFDWYNGSRGPLRCSIELDAERLMITPGLNKYKAGYAAPFDKHRDLANGHIDRAARLLAIGYGFNDDHLQTHLVRRIQSGTPTLILTMNAGSEIEKLADSAPACICVSRSLAGHGVAVVAEHTRFDNPGKDLWDLGVLAKEIL